MAVTAALAGIVAASAALAQSAECARLQAAIAAAPRGGGQLQAAADRQRAELSRTSAYAHSIGCDNQKFLFFGSSPPPQCGEIKGQIARMQASLADLQARSGGGRGDLVARYNAECVNAPRQPSNIFEALFGGVARQFNPDELPPPDEQQQMIEKSIENEKKGANVSAGSYAVCVRTCDGSFFPVSYSGAGSRADSLEEVCRSLCPNADVQLYSFPLGGTIDQAVSTAGERYVDLPNALKFQQSFDSTCSCRRKGESWAQALAAAEARYGHEFARHSGDAGEIAGDVAADHCQGRDGPEGEGDEDQRQGDRPGARRRDPGPRNCDARPRNCDPGPRRRDPGPRRQWRRHRAQRRGGGRQPRDLGHRRRRRAGRRALQRRPGPNRDRDRPRRGHPEGADSRANALARPISGNSAANSGPDSRPVSASRRG